MTRITWYDITNIGIEDKNRVPPRNWYCEFMGVEVFVHRDVFTDNNWMLTCENFGMRNIDIGYSDVDEAKLEALIFIKAHIDNSIAKFLGYSQALGKEYRLQLYDEPAEGWVQVTPNSNYHFIRSNGKSLCKRYNGYEDARKESRIPGHEKDCAICAREYAAYMNQIKMKGDKIC